MQKHRIELEASTLDEMRDEVRALAVSFGIMQENAKAALGAEEKTAAPEEKPEPKAETKRKPAKKKPEPKAEEPKAEEPEEPKAEESKAEEPEEPEESKAEEPEYTLDDVRGAVQEYVQAHGNAKGKALVTAFGANKVSGIAPDHYGPFVKACGMAPEAAEKYAAGFASAGE